MGSLDRRATRRRASATRGRRRRRSLVRHRGVAGAEDRPAGPTGGPGTGGPHRDGGGADARGGTAAGRRRGSRAPGLAPSPSRGGATAGARGRRRGAALPARRRAGMVRTSVAGAHPPLHARAAAARDRAGHRRRAVALPRVLAARRPGLQARRAEGCGRGGSEAGGLRGPGSRVGGQHPARPRPRLQARLARPSHAGRRRRVGPTMGRRELAHPVHADLSPAA
jgi:hypothetical protein